MGEREKERERERDHEALDKMWAPRVELLEATGICKNDFLLNELSRSWNI
jgi:hypothetical protein